MLWQLVTVLALLFSVVIALFAVANHEAVTVSYFFGEARISLVLLILGSALAGAFVMAMLSLVRHIKISFRIKELQRKNRDLDKQLEELSSEKEKPEKEAPPVETQESGLREEEAAEVEERENNNSSYN